MAGLFDGINTMSTALRAFQQELDTTGHNVSNVDTPGYSRQVAVLGTMDPSTYVQGNLISIGNGVTVQMVNRVRDMFLEGQRVDATSTQGQMQAKSDGLSNVESTFTDANGSGISSSLTAFFNSWSALATKASGATQGAVQAAGQKLADQVRGTYSDLQTISTQNDTQIQQTITDIQTQANTIAKLNDQIRKQTAAGGQPNDLLDQRDQAVRDLSALTDVQVQRNSDNTYTVAMGSILLVNQSGAQTVPTNYNAANGTLSDAKGTYPVTNGKLAGLFDVQNSVKSYQSQLDSFANTLRTQVNTLFKTVTNSSGATGMNFFNDVISGPQTGAADFDLDSAGVTGPPACTGVKTNASAIGSGTTGASADNGVANALASLNTTSVSGLGNQTLSGFYTNLATTIGRDSAQASSDLSTQTTVISQIDNQIQSVSGVSLDDEMANMLRYQRAYQSAAKVLSTMDGLMDNLLAMVA